MKLHFLYNFCAILKENGLGVIMCGFADLFHNYFSIQYSWGALWDGWRRHY